MLVVTAYLNGICVLVCPLNFIMIERSGSVDSIMRVLSQPVIKISADTQKAARRPKVSFVNDMCGFFLIAYLRV